MTRQEIYNKHFDSDPEAWEEIDDTVTFSSKVLFELMNDCYLEDAKSATPHGGHNPEHFEKFTKQD